MLENILKNIDKDNEWFINTRRDLHEIPELDFELPKTIEYISNILDELQVDYKKVVNNSGIVANIYGKNKNITIALRADIDALPILENTNCDFISKHSGAMHACGHDIHTSILLGVIKTLKENENILPCNIRFLFQPAEETTGGALPMIKEGYLDGVSAIFGLHVDPSIQCGSIGIKYGAMNASSYRVSLDIHGKSTHGAYPSGGVDAIVVASQVISSLQSIVSRNIDSRDSAVISFGTINGGSTENIMANHVNLTGTVRTLSSYTKDFTKKRISEMVEFICKGYGAMGTVNFIDSYNALINHKTYVDIIKEGGNKILGSDKVIIKTLPDMGVEDFAYFLERVPGAFFNLGVKNKELGANYPLHNEKFMADEKAIALGVKLQISNIFKSYEFLSR